MSGTLFNYSPLTDGPVHTAADHNTPMAQIAAILNGGIGTLNIVPGGLDASVFDATASPVSRMSEMAYNFIASGGVWTGDSYASTRAASMSAMVCYINGIRLSVAGVSGRLFTASKDAYVDVGSDGVLVYTEVSNNAASPSLAANSIRIGIIITGASNIADSGSINQGEVTKALPIVSSVPYTVTDSLGNLIGLRTPYPKIIGFRRGGSGGSGGDVSRTGIAPTPVIIPVGRRIKVTGGITVGNFGTAQNSTSDCSVVEDGTTTIVAGVAWLNGSVAASNASRPIAIGPASPTAGLHTYTLSQSLGGGFQMSQYSNVVLIIELD